MLRQYQKEAIDSINRDLASGHKRVIAALATGAGKTVIAGELAKRQLPGRVLFLADAQALVHQAADKFQQFCGVCPGIEMGQSTALQNDVVVVATTQSLSNRLDKYSRDWFDLIIVDECHRNTIGAQALSVLNHFEPANVVGLSATPSRSDKRSLSEFYEKISCDIDLFRLIDEGFLSPIKIKTVPCNVDLSKVSTLAGDYSQSDLGHAIDPHIFRLAEILKENASDRKTVVFLPLIETSKQFAAACNELGLKAVHVDGKDSQALNEDWQVVCNASLLSTGWDCPQIDCVYILRLTKSFELYSQMIGRGTRICEGKKDLLILDPLFQSADHRLCRPASIIARDGLHKDTLQEKLDQGLFIDLQDADDASKVDYLKAIQKRIEETKTNKSKTIDAYEMAVSLADDELMNYEACFAWEKRPASEKQLETLAAMGFDVDTVKNKGHASKIIDIMTVRRNRGLATPKQVKYLIKFNHKSPHTATFKQAGFFLNKIFGRKRA